MLRVFISHSSEDLELVERLVDLLRSGLNLSAEDIRCTSLDGHRLPAGAQTDDRIRQEVHEAETLIGVISESSLGSLYVAFELGARWGVGKPLIPLLAPGIEPSVLSGPLSSLNALSCTRPAQLHQLINDLGSQLHVTTEAPAVVQSRIDRIVAMAPSKGAETSSTGVVIAPPNAAPSSADFDDADEVIKRHCFQEWGDNYRMRASCEKKQREALAKLQRDRPSDIPEEIFKGIRTNCAREWPDNFRMRFSCESKQIEAYRELRQG